MEQAKIDGRRKYLTVEEVANHLGIGPSTVRREIVRGNLKAKRFGERNVRVHVGEIARYEERSGYEE